LRWRAEFAPLEGWRRIKVTDRHTAIDYAHMLKDLADRTDSCWVGVSLTDFALRWAYRFPRPAQ
jgi:hypothetical protein